jgi:hypothetical protein
LDSYKGFKFSENDQKNLWESFKVEESDSLKALEDRKVNVKDLVGTKLNRKTKRIDELIFLQQTEDQKISDRKLLGL